MSLMLFLLWGPGLELSWCVTTAQGAPAISYSLQLLQPFI